MFDKKQAAEYLEVTTRSLERYTNEGRISVRYEQSPNGEVAMFDPEELKNFKADRQTSRIKPTVVPERSAQTDPPTDLPSQIARSPQTQTERYNPQSESTQGLATLIAPLAGIFGDLTRALDRFGSRVTTVELRSKLLLTLDEAQTITGLSRDLLVDAIRAGELPSKIMGKAYRIKTQDLEQYIAKLKF
jgi:excisionase family DNA binding protein